MKAKNEWANFKEIKEKVGMKDVLDYYGALKGLKREENKLINCPLCSENHHSKRSFWMNRDENIWHCFSCGEGGNVLDFICAMENVDVKLAALLLQKWFGIILDEDREMIEKIKPTSLLGR